MEWSIVSSVLLAIVITTTISILSRRRKSLGHGPKLPPGPPGWPIIGNLFDLGSMPHRSLADLRPKYGEVVWLKLGAINTMAVLSSRAAAELFRHHDLSFATRALTETSRAHDYHLSSVALAPYGAYWRVMRRLMTTEMFVGRRVGETAPLRRRICAGLPLAQCLLHFVLGSLIHHFDWRLDEKVSRETMDMRDRMGIVARKLEPLFAVPTKCL
ncbi:Cytochrome P [Trema orientale]|uniref:Cytochrome P n=1 Tax=Trema orientale TaxID=63057 RepID=A0A2P5BW08_TREOI|nr:Cytochrome P [Trema orientale]